ncbi:MAG TPA: insulinase family protein [Halothiobacillaceae bacterium]|nr:insulinase family protein [Halothiobacillaceae bacterium]
MKANKHTARPWWHGYAAGLLGLGLSSAVIAEASVPEVHSHTLDNGLKVLVLPDQRAPVVTQQIWYRAGSMDEPAGATGIAHMFEHMMFKGTENLAPGEFSEIIARLGGQENAFTSRDYTAYFQTLSNEHLETAMQWEADRLANLVIDPDEFQSERDVVKEEWRMRMRDNPNARLSQQLYATAFVNSGYHHPIIGWEPDIDAYSVEDLHQWRAQFYHPDNATLVIVGDVDPKTVFSLAEKHYGPIPAGFQTERKPRTEIKQHGTKRLKLELPARLPRLMMGYKVPSLVTAEEAWHADALTVLAALLSGGESSRFANELVRENKLSRAWANYTATARAQTLFTLTAIPNQDQPIEEVEAVLREQIERLKTELVSTEELARIQAQVVASDVYQRDSMFFQGMRLGIYQTAGLDYRDALRCVERIQAITPEQIQKVAKMYFSDESLTIAELKPLPLDTDERPNVPQSLEEPAHVAY